MNKILIDTMHVADILIDDSYFELAQAVENKKILGFVSTITLTELVKIHGKKNKEKIYIHRAPGEWGSLVLAENYLEDRIIVNQNSQTRI